MRAAEISFGSPIGGDVRIAIRTRSVRFPALHFDRTFNT
jgi:hypothetical protein